MGLCTLIWSALQVQLPPHEFTQGSADYQTQASALAGSVGADLGKGLEQTLLVFDADADAAVFDAE
ncbi:hypothetical protein D3C84_850200 [compost metagenome]